MQQTLLRLNGEPRQDCMPDNSNRRIGIAHYRSAMN